MELGVEDIINSEQAAAKLNEIREKAEKAGAKEAQAAADTSRLAAMIQMMYQAIGKASGLSGEGAAKVQGLLASIQGLESNLGSLDQAQIDGATQVIDTFTQGAFLDIATVEATMANEAANPEDGSGGADSNSTESQSVGSPEAEGAESAVDQVAQLLAAQGIEVVTAEKPERVTTKVGGTTRST